MSAAVGHVVELVDRVLRGGGTTSVFDAVARFMLALDDHDWDGVTAALGETVRRDDTSLFGGEPDEIAGSGAGR